jgi:two pore calcium channel protein
MGFKNYARHFANKFEILLNTLALFFWIFILLPNDYRETYGLILILCIRSFRIVKLLSRIEEYNIILKTFLGLLPAYGRIMGVFLFMFYIFSEVGQYLFGGLAFEENEEIQNNPAIPPLYIYMNFNDFGSGLVTLFQLLVVNNWFVTADMFATVTNKYARVYFAVFYMLVVLIVMNLIVAFILDMFIS